MKTRNYTIGVNVLNHAKAAVQALKNLGQNLPVLTIQTPCALSEIHNCLEKCRQVLLIAESEPSETCALSALPLKSRWFLEALHDDLMPGHRGKVCSFIRAMFPNMGWTTAKRGREE